MSSKGVLQAAMGIMYYPIIGGCLGVCEALLIQQVHFRCKAHGHTKEGHLWMWNSIREWSEELRMGKSTVQRALYHLEGLGVLVVGKFNKHKYDNTKWYRVEYTKLIELLEKHYGDQHEIVVDSLFKMNEPPSQNEQAHLFKTGKPIPEIYTEIPTENSFSPTGGKQFGKIIMKTPAVRAADIVKDKGWELKKNKDKAKAVAAGKPVKLSASSMLDVWREVVPTLETSAGCIPVMTIEQGGLLSRLVKVWGSNAPDVLRYILSNWVGYAKHVADMTGMFKVPYAPAIPFLVKYANEALTYYKLSSVQLIAPHDKKQPKIVIKKMTPKVAIDKPQQASDVPTQHDGDGGVASVEDILKYVTL